MWVNETRGNNYLKTITTLQIQPINSLRSIFEPLLDSFLAQWSIPFVTTVRFATVTDHYAIRGLTHTHANVISILPAFRSIRFDKSLIVPVYPQSLLRSKPNISLSTDEYWVSSDGRFLSFMWRVYSNGKELSVWTGLDIFFFLLFIHVKTLSKVFHLLTISNKELYRCFDHIKNLITERYRTPSLSYNAVYALYGMVISIYDVVTSIYCMVISIHGAVVSLYGVILSIHGVCLSIYGAVTSIFCVIISIYCVVKTIYAVMISIHVVVKLIYDVINFIYSAVKSIYDIVISI